MDAVVDADRAHDADDIWGYGDSREDARDDTEAIADFIKNEWLQQELDAYCAAAQSVAERPLIESLRPIINAAHDDFLRGREGWADAVIEAIERVHQLAEKYDGKCAIKLIDGDQFARTREDAALRLACLMGWFFPKDNPLTEAQGARCEAVGMLDGWDGHSPIRMEDMDLVVLDLAMLLQDLDQKPIGSVSVFPQGIGLEKAVSEAKRWYTNAPGRVFGEPDEPASLAAGGANGGESESKKGTLTPDERKEIVKKALRTNPDLKTQGSRKWEDATGIPESTIRKMAAYKACKEYRPPPKPKAESFNKYHEDNIGRPDETLQDLLGSHERDKEPSPLDPRNLPNPVCHKQV